MSTLPALLSEYGESHQNPTNKLVHWVCVPLIMFSLLGLLWSVPMPAALRAISPWLNLGTLVMLLAIVYYLRLSVRLSIGMLLVWAMMAAALRFVDASVPDCVRGGLDRPVLGTQSGRQETILPERLAVSTYRATVATAFRVPGPGVAVLTHPF